MRSSCTIVLPGLDGTDLLLNSFVRLASPSERLEVISLPDDPSDNYQSLCDKLSIQIQELRDGEFQGLQGCHLIAESFSGPLAILLAHQHPQLIQRLTLVASFASSPIPSLGRVVPWTILVRLPVPKIVALSFFAGGDQKIASKLIEAVKHTSPATLAKRINLLKNVDVCQELSQLNCPIDYIRPTSDRLVPRRCVDQIASTNDRVRVLEIDGPHLILQTRPEQAWTAMKRN